MSRVEHLGVERLVNPGRDGFDVYLGHQEPASWSHQSSLQLREGAYRLLGWRAEAL